MKYYLNFYKDNDNFMVKADEYDNNVKTNFEEFNALVFLEEKVEHNKITDYKLIIEKEENGNYNYMSSFSGKYNYNDGTVEFLKCNFKKSLSTNANFIVYIELYEGGIRVFNGKDRHLKVILRKECVDFKIDVEGSKNILDVFEIEDEFLESLNIKITSQEESKFNTFMYYLEINKNESVTPNTFKPFGNKEIELIEIITPEMFLNNETYIHVFLKDSFNNTKYKKFHLVTKNSKFTCFEIKDEIKKIRNVTENISVFFEERSVEYLNPVIQYNQNIQIKSETKIGLLNKRNGYFDMKLSDYFTDINDIENCQLFFTINGSNILSNPVYIDIDNKEPKIFFNNLDEDNYMIVRDETENVNLTGVIEDKNFFYVGNGSIKCDFEDIGYNLIVRGNNFDKVVINGSECIYIKGEEYSYVLSDTYGTPEFFLNNESITLEYIDDYEENGKVVFVIFDSTELSTYENNIISTQGNLKLKNDKITKQQFFKICNKYIIKAIFGADTTTDERVDLGIDNFDYSFLRKLESKNVSCELTGDKKFIMDFTSTRLVFLSKLKDELIKYNKTRILSKREGFHLEGLTVFPISLKPTENFTTKNNVVYIDNKYNEKNKEDIYGEIGLTLNETPAVIKNLIMERVNESSFMFSFYTSIKDGINMFSTTIYDENGNMNQNSFVIEKTNKSIKLDFEKENKNYNILEKETYNEVTTNKDKFTVKVYVLNETYKQKNQDNYIGVHNGSYEKKYKIFNDRDNRVALIELEGKDEEKRYEVYYINGENKDIVYTLKKDFIKIYTEKDIVTGLKEYYLYIEKDEFIKINTENSNSNLKVEYEKDKERLKISRLNDERVIENDIIKIFAFDENGVFKPYKHEVNVEFYNDNILNNFRIDEISLIDDKIFNPKFNLKFNILSPDDVKRVYYYDELENDILLREKEYVLENGTYIIKDITTPLESAEKYIYIIFQNGVEIRKEILKDTDITLHLIENPFKTAYSKDNESITFKIKNDNKNPKDTNIIIRYDNKNVIKKTLFSPYQTIEFKIENLVQKDYNFEILYEENRKIYKIEDLFISLQKNNIDFEIEKLPILSIFSLNEPKIFTVNTKEDHSKIKIKTVSDRREIKEFSIINKKIDFQFNDKGVYEIYVYYQDKNNQKLLKTYIMQIYIDKKDYLDFNLENFEKFSFISSVLIKNKSIIQTENIMASVEYHLNSKAKKTIFPKINNEEMLFILPKEVGRNEYFYKDTNGSFKLSDINIKKMIINATHKFEIPGDKNEIYQKIENDYIFESKTDVTFAVGELNKIEVYSYNTRRTSVQYVMGRSETKINSILLPCKITAYNKDDFKVEEVNLLINEVSKVSFRLVKSKTVKVSFENKLTRDSFIMLKDTLNIPIKHKKKHRLYHEYVGIAVYHQVKEWLALTVEERNEVLILLDNKAYDKTSVKKTNENLKRLFLKYYNKGDL